MPSDRWNAGEYLREEFTFNLPATWSAAEVLVGLVIGTNDGSRPDFAGPQPANDPSCLSLGPGRLAVPTAPSVPAVPSLSPTISPNLGGGQGL